MAITAGIVIIGDEILSGMVPDRNSLFMAKELKSRGVELSRISMIPDDVDEIALIVKQFSERYDYVFTSGGIGPTHDDVSIEGISKAFNVRPVTDDYLQGLLRERYGGNLTPERLKMAQVPEGAELIMDEALKFPLIKFKNVYIHPGVPKFLKDKFLVAIKHVNGPTKHLKKAYVEERESGIAPFLNEIISSHKDVKIGCYHNEHPHLLVTFESFYEGKVGAALKKLMNILPGEKIIRVE